MIVTNLHLALIQGVLTLLLAWVLLPKRKAAVVVLVLGFCCVAAVGLGPRVDLPLSHLDRTRRYALPLWVEMLYSNPVVPGTGLAGVNIGESEADFLTRLGPPTAGPSATKSLDGRILHYTTQYRHRSLFLGLYSEPQTRTLSRLRLSDHRFDVERHLPPIHASVSLGSLDEEVLDALGEPAARNSHFTCPRGLPSTEATTFVYEGFKLWICHRRVYLLEIP